MARTRLKKNFSIEDLKAKLLSKIVVDQLTGCWLWTDYIRPNGYAHMRVGRKAQPAIHRMSYELFKGKIPENYHVHHLCEIKHCCNPEHLELQLPSQHQSLHRSHITHCPKGHPYDEENTYSLVAMLAGVKNALANGLNCGNIVLKVSLTKSTITKTTEQIADKVIEL